VTTFQTAVYSLDHVGACASAETEKAAYKGGCTKAGFHLVIS
jgi:hypothetical protein